MISLRTHNILDYAIGIVLFVCPALFGFADIDAARNTFVFLGGGLILYSLLTDYEYSIAKWIPVGLHMALDVAIGFGLMLSPSIFDYRSQLTGVQNVLHFVLGLGTIALVVFTRPQALAISSEIETTKFMTEEEERKRAA